MSEKPAKPPLTIEELRDELKLDVELDRIEQMTDDELTAALERRGITAEDLAKSAEKDRAMIARLRAEQPPTSGADKLAAIAGEFEMDDLEEEMRGKTQEERAKIIEREGGGSYEQQLEVRKRMRAKLAEKLKELEAADAAERKKS